MKKTKNEGRTQLLRSGLVTLLFSSICGLAAGPLSADPLSIHTQQEMVEEVMKSTANPPALDINNPLSVFEAVFASLPEHVKVYPTESYYYFTFPYKGVIYAGNIRFDAWDQFDGKVHFAYFQQYQPWRETLEPAYKKLGPDEGLQVKQIDKFHYTITFKGKTIAFEIPDLSNVKPKPGMLRSDEVYLGPAWDDSGVQFFFLYNKTAKTFLYLLNDSPHMDDYAPSDIAPSATIGNRSGFVFYKDKLMDRQILAGVYGLNVAMNNYFDGPFDQLPDNYIEGDALRDAIIDKLGTPKSKGDMDRYGGSPDGSVRYGITPYKIYNDLSEVKPVIECAEKNDDPKAHYTCFDVNNDQEAEQGDKTGQANQSQKTK